MSCQFKCDNNNSAYLVFPILHRNFLNQEYVCSYLFCSPECRSRFIDESTFIENDYYYYYIRKEHPTGYKPTMKEEVEEHKKKYDLLTSIKSLFEKKEA